jgi:hypothetical protein
LICGIMSLGSCALMHDKTLVKVEREFLIAGRLEHRNMEFSVALGHTYFCKPVNTNMQKVLETMILGHEILIWNMRTWNIDSSEYNLDLNGK